MIIGIDISQIAYTNSGVSNYLKNFIRELLTVDAKNSYILFFSSLRQNLDISFLKGIKNPRVEVRIFHFPPFLLDIIWNKFHVFPIENLIGKVDIFISSDWTQPPATNSLKATIIYDLIVYKYPEETHHATSFNFLKFVISPDIVSVQKRRLGWVKNEADIVFCISESSKRDINKILNIPNNKIQVIYPGI